MAMETNPCIQLFLDKALKFITSVPRWWYEDSSEQEGSSEGSSSNEWEGSSSSGLEDSCSSKWEASELDWFEARVSTLQTKFATHTSLLEKTSLQDEDEEMLKQLAIEGGRLLDKENEHLTKYQRSDLSRQEYGLYDKAFHGKLGIILARFESVLNADTQPPQFNIDMSSLLNAGTQPPLANKDMSNFLKRNRTTVLPFRKDSRYVPIVRVIGEVRKVLDEYRVVTVYGEPGSGKTSLVKYIALHYQSHTPQMLREAASSAVFPDQVYFLHCDPAERSKIEQLQHYLLQSLGCGSEPVLEDTREEGEGDDVIVPTVRKRLQDKLRNLKALIILDGVWERSVLEELILSRDEARSVKYLLTSQIIDIWPNAKTIPMERPSLDEARQILLNYTSGLSTETGFPKDIQVTADSIIRDLDFHPLALASLALGFHQQNSREPGAWTAVKDLWELEPPIEQLCKPLIYGKRYSLSLSTTMIRIMNAVDDAARDLLFLMCILNHSGVPETAVRYLYECANLGTESGYEFNVNYLRNRSLVETRSYHYDETPDQYDRPMLSKTELVVHKLRALSIRSKFAGEVRALVGRALNPLREMYAHLSTETTMIPRRYFPSAVRDLVGRAWKPVRKMYDHLSAKPALVSRYFPSEVRVLDLLVGRVLKPVHLSAKTTLTRDYECTSVNDGLLNATMVGMYIHKYFLNDARAAILSGVDLYFFAYDLLETARGKEKSLRSMVELLFPDPTVEEWNYEAGMCAKKIIVKFACRSELDDESVERLIELPGTRDIVLSFLKTILQDGYWCVTFLQHKTTFSSAHSGIAGSLSNLVHDDETSSEMLDSLVGVLFGGDHDVHGMLDYENDDTIIKIGERLIKEALGKHSNIGFQCYRLLRSCSCHSRVFGVIEKNNPDLWKALWILRVDVQSVGFTNFNQEFDGRNILILYHGRPNEKGLDMVFFHGDGMANLIGVGLPFGKVSIIQDLELRIEIHEISESSWRTLWANSTDNSLQSFQPIIIDCKTLQAKNIPKIFYHKAGFEFRNDRERVEEYEFLDMRGSNDDQGNPLQWWPDWIQMLRLNYERRQCFDITHPSRSGEYCSVKTSQELGRGHDTSQVSGLSPVVLQMSRNVSGDTNTNSRDQQQRQSGNDSQSGSETGWSQDFPLSDSPNGDGYGESSVNQAQVGSFSDEKNLSKKEMRLVVKIFFNNECEIRSEGGSGTAGASAAGLGVSNASVASARAGDAGETSPGVGNEGVRGFNGTGPRGPARRFKLSKVPIVKSLKWFPWAGGTDIALSDTAMIGTTVMDTATKSTVTVDVNTSRVELQMEIEFLCNVDNWREIDVKIVVDFQMNEENTVEERFGWYQDALTFAYNCKDKDEGRDAVILDKEHSKLLSECAPESIMWMENDEQSKSDTHGNSKKVLQGEVGVSDGTKCSERDVAYQATEPSKEIKQIERSALVNCLTNAKVFAMTNRTVKNHMKYVASLHAEALKRIGRPYRWLQAGRDKASQLGVFSTVRIEAQARWVVLGEGNKTHAFDARKTLTMFTKRVGDAEDSREKYLQVLTKNFKVNHSFFHKNFNRWKRQDPHGCMF